MHHNLTTTLTLLLVAAQRKAGDFEYRVHEVIKNLLDLAGWADDRKADLYALLVESVEPDDKMITIERKVHAALHKNEKNFYGKLGKQVSQ